MFWHKLKMRAPAGLRRALIAAPFGLLALAGGAAPASAGIDNFCNRAVAFNEVCQGPTHTLTASRGTNTQSGVGCGGEIYGEYYCATPAGCHAYNGAAVRTPGIRHRATTSRTMQGYSTWGTTVQPSYCDPGFRYSVAGPVTSADPVGVPVLGRKRERAPRAVAALWSTANPDDARRFSTPNGDGWVMVVPADRKVCLAVPDPVDGGYGYSCQSYNEARLGGTLVTLEDSDTSTAEGDLVVALPAEGTDGLNVTRRDGSVREVPASGGVVAVELGAADTAIALDAADGSDLSAQKWSVGRR